MKRKSANVLFILSDEHNKRISGCYGHPMVKTPWIDSIANSGVRFDNAYCNNPICVPSRASLTIGDYASRRGYWDNAFPYDGETPGFGHRVREAGLPVVTIGKLHYKGNDPATGFADQRIPLNVKDGIGDVFGSLRSLEQHRPNLATNVTSARWGDSDYLRYDRSVAEEAARFLREEANSFDEPWLLKVGFVCPHFPLIAPEKYREIYPPAKVPFPKRYRLGERPQHPVLNEMRRYMNVEGEFTEEEVRRAVAVYYGMTAEVDHQIGRVLTALRETGLDRETLVIYTSDHGDMVGAQGLWWKHAFYEESAGVPFVMSGPGIPAGRVVRQGISLVDLYPTILDSLGLTLTDAERKLPGRSLLPVAAGEEELENDRIVYSEYFAASSVTGGYMIRKGDYKLCYYAYCPNQLFNLRDDPEETNDLAGDPAHEQILDELETELRKIVDPERTALQARIAQLDKIDQYGGFKKVLKRGETFTYSPVPTQFHK